MRLSRILGPLMERLAQSRTTFKRDRDLLNLFMDNVYKIPDEITSHTTITTLSNSRMFVLNRLPSRHKRAIIYLHGGAMCLSLWKFYLPFVYRLAKETDSTVFMPDYRLAPECPFPCGLEDCLEAFDSLVGTDGYDESVVVGDSAGGNLAVNLARQRSDNIRGLCLLSPWLDLTHTSVFFQRNNLDEVVHRGSADRAAWLYVMGDRDWTFGSTNPLLRREFDELIRDPRVSPVFSNLGELSGKRILIQASTSERLVGDSVNLFKRLGANLRDEDLLGDPKSVLRYIMGEQSLTLWPNEPHVWQITRPKSNSAQEAISEVVTFCRKCFDSPYVSSE